MAVAAVQRIAKGGVSASMSIGSGDGWVTPTAGNLLLVFGNADATLTMGTAGFTAGPNIVDGNGAYAWYKSAAGTESAITITPSVSDDVVLTVCEYSGVIPTPLDASNSSTIASSNGVVTSAAVLSSTAAGDLIVGAALTHSPAASTPTGASWSGGFVNVLTADSGTANPITQRCTSFVGELMPAGAAGSYSTVCTWTNTAFDRQHIILAFKAAAAPVGPVAVQSLVTQATNRSYTY
jgi:hypothetical protein